MQDLGVGERGATLGGVDGHDAGPGVGADDRHRLAGGQRADVGHLGDDAEVAVGRAQQQPAAARLTGGVDGAPELLGGEPQRDHGARKDGGGQVGQGEADEIGAGGRAGPAAGGRITHEYMLPIR